VPSTLGGLLARDGHFDEAASLLLEVWARPDRRSWPPWTVIAVAGMLAISLVETGHLEECDRILRDVEPVAESLERDGRQPSAPGLAAVRIASGRRTYLDSDVQTAAVLLRHAVELAELHPRPTTLCLGQLYLADAELANGDRPAALTAVSRARELVDEEPVSAFVVRRLEEVETRLGRRAARAAVRSGALVEELTDRELSVLRALQGSATQREIGAALFLSINTVKAYSKSLYRKLGVASRQDAVATGRHLGLI
jgi:LuxR family maltose regulon positive regulatory protein